MTDRPEPTFSRHTDVERAQQCARFYRTLGYNALPSRADHKCPTLGTYADFWERPLPDTIYDGWAATNIQLMTGTHWRLCVVDCDGYEAHDTWRRMRNHHGLEGPHPTWIVRTGGGGYHYYFTLPAWLDECPSRRLWGLWDTGGGKGFAGEWVKHREIRLLGDRSLAIAVPSRHVESGTEYEFMIGHGPREFPRPAPAPAWLLNLAGVVNPNTTVAAPRLDLARRPPIRSLVRPAGAFYERDAVLAQIGDKIALARSWGLRVATSRANAKGWYSCHAIDREDVHPSASFHADSGVYAELREGRRLAFFDLAVALGQYPTWEEAKNDLGSRYTPVPVRQAPGPVRGAPACAGKTPSPIRQVGANGANGAVG